MVRDCGCYVRLVLRPIVPAVCHLCVCGRSLNRVYSVYDHGHPKYAISISAEQLQRDYPPENVIHQRDGLLLGAQGRVVVWKYMLWLLSIFRGVFVSDHEVFCMVIVYDGGLYVYDEFLLHISNIHTVGIL